MRKNNKRALIVSMLSLLLCVSMLVGTTMAWFTDTASVKASKLEAGTLDISLAVGEWENSYMGAATKTTDITDSETPLIPEDILWEPGYLWYANLIVKNNGSLAAKVKATLVPTTEVGKLAEVIDVYTSTLYPFVDSYGEGKNVRGYINGDYAGSTDGPFSAFNSLNPPKKIGTLAEVISGQIPLVEEHSFIGNTTENEQNNHLIAIALKMQETAGNDYQKATAGSFDIRVVATQYTYEKDSYDNQYDKDAAYPVSSLVELESAMKDPTVSNVVVDGGVYNKTVTIVDGKSVISEKGTFDTSKDEGKQPALVVEAGANLVLNGGTYAAANQQILNVQTNDAKVVINGGTFNGSALAWNCGNNGIEINGGEFNVWTISVTDSGTTGIITINGGNFKMTADDGFNAGTSVPMVINGGTFNQNPSEFVNAETHKVVENADGIFTVTAK